MGPVRARRSYSEAQRERNGKAVQHRVRRSAGRAAAPPSTILPNGRHDSVGLNRTDSPRPATCSSTQ
ncbi:hypothetical protein ANCCEY_13690 [Ancylostoma ceylanicum]|uniref:Uncharacterized protein n=1 Tax=Ancylostoma ceylanicum TaxID=53326 RepID=A0A0D6LBM0_9BILA|nr:hypothetical protein ANCCEY_13690 [Ancylostoma ceylanicum]